MTNWLSLSSVARPLALGLAVALSAACSSNDDDTTPTASAASAVTPEDVVDADEILIEDTGAGATRVGDPAIWLEAARAEAKQANSFARAVLGRLSDMAKNNQPTRQITLPSNVPLSIWKEDKDGVTYTLAVSRTNENRFRYYLEGRKGADRKPLLTGVFIKRSTKRGSGRLHIDLSNMNELTGAPAATGRLHLWFANGGEARARRIRYREVRPVNLGAEGAINYAFDGIRKPGKGGALRSHIIGDLGARIPDLADQKGIELGALRVRWTPEGGRVDAALFDVTKGGLVKLGDVHECWDGGGLRKAYKSFTGKENEGDTVDKVACGGLDEDTPPATVTDEGETEPEVDAELAEASTIAEDEASTAIDISNE